MMHTVYSFASDRPLADRSQHPEAPINIQQNLSQSLARSGNIYLSQNPHRLMVRGQVSKVFLSGKEAMIANVEALQDDGTWLDVSACFGAVMVQIPIYGKKQGIPQMNEVIELSAIFKANASGFYIGTKPQHYRLTRGYLCGWPAYATSAK